MYDRFNSRKGNYLSGSTIFSNLNIKCFTKYYIKDKNQTDILYYMY